MRGNSARVAWYWLRATLARHWSSYLTSGVLVGLVGGLAIVPLGAARRTQSSFNVFLASTNPSNLSVLLPGANLTSNLARLPLVRRVSAAQLYVVGLPAGSHGAPSASSSARSSRRSTGKPWSTR